MDRAEILDALSDLAAELAHRVGEDEGDVLLLAAALGLDSAEQVLAIAEETFGDRLDASARFFVEEIFDA